MNTSCYLSRLVIWSYVSNLWLVITRDVFNTFQSLFCLRERKVVTADEVPVIELSLHSLSLPKQSFLSKILRNFHATVTVRRRKCLHESVNLCVNPNATWGTHFVRHGNFIVDLLVESLIFCCLNDSWFRFCSLLYEFSNVYQLACVFCFQEYTSLQLNV